MLLLATFVVAVVPAAGDVDAPVVAEHELKAEYVWRFTLFVDWPLKVMVSGSESLFAIGVVGASPVQDLLKARTDGRSIRGRPVVVREIANLDEIEGCHMLFIANSSPYELDEILARTAGKPVLTISESNGYAERGVLINLFIADDRVRFEINQAAVRRSGLVFRSKLYKVARLIGGEE